MLRLISLIFAGLACVFLGADLEAAGGGMTFRAVGDYWFAIDPDSLQLAQPAIERHVWPPLWDPVLVTLLTWPAVFVAAGAAVVFYGFSNMFRRRRAQH